MKPERVDVEARIMQAVDRAEAAAHYDAFSILADTLRAVAAERDAAEHKLAQLEGRRCSAGHETLPLRLWGCPACTEELRRRAENAEAEVKKWHDIPGVDACDCPICARVREREVPYDNHGAPKVSGPEGGPVDFTEPGVERGDEGRRFAP